MKIIITKKIIPDIFTGENYIGVKAHAELQFTWQKCSKRNYSIITTTIDSPGIWGIFIMESEEHIDEIYKEEITILMDMINMIRGETIEYEFK